MAKASSVDAADAARAMRVLVAICDAGSFTAAAAKLAMTPSAVSKAVDRTESRLGVRLVQRTTQRIALTDAGAAYVARGRAILAELEGLESEVAGSDGRVRGVLRVSAPAIYGALRVAPVAAELQRLHPELEVQLWCDDRLIDLVAERVSVAVRILATPPAEFVARELASDRRGLFASPAYLKRAGTPAELASLSSHATITYSGSNAAEALRRGRVVFTTDNILAAREAARAGVGIAELAHYLAEDDVRDGRLCEILPRTIRATRKVWALYLQSRWVSPATRAFVKALVAASKPHEREPASAGS